MAKGWRFPRPFLTSAAVPDSVRQREPQPPAWLEENVRPIGPVKMLATTEKRTSGRSDQVWTKRIVRLSCIREPARKHPQERRAATLNANTGYST